VSTVTTHTLNGVDTSRLNETVQAVQGNPELAKFQFRARNTWVTGGQNCSTIQEFYGAGAEDTTRTKPFMLEADEPPVLLGRDLGANPVEYVLHALAACLTTSMVYHAAARGIAVESVKSTLEGDLDLRGFLGLDPSVRKGYQGIRVSFDIQSSATPEQLAELTKFSPVHDIVSNAVPVSIEIRTTPQTKGAAQ
jgi:uncharacterized OsmC-like protein